MLRNCAVICIVISVAATCTIDNLSNLSNEFKNVSWLWSSKRSISPPIIMILSPHFNDLLQRHNQISQRCSSSENQSCILYTHSQKNCLKLIDHPQKYVQIQFRRSSFLSRNLHSIETVFTPFGKTNPKQSTLQNFGGLSKIFLCKYHRLQIVVILFYPLFSEFLVYFVTHFHINFNLREMILNESIEVTDRSLKRNFTLIISKFSPKLFEFQMYSESV